MRAVGKSYAVSIAKRRPSDLKRARSRTVTGMGCSFLVPGLSPPGLFLILPGRWLRFFCPKVGICARFRAKEPAEHLAHLLEDLFRPLGQRLPCDVQHLPPESGEGVAATQVVHPGGFPRVGLPTVGLDGQSSLGVGAVASGDEPSPVPYLVLTDRVGQTASLL